MFVSKVKVFMKAGDGGKGIISFRREKYVPMGGPDGGNGGNGGNIVLLGDKSINTLSYFRYHRHFFAENGVNGSGSNCHGKNGEDTIIKVPVGTDIFLIEKIESDSTIYNSSPLNKDYNNDTDDSYNNNENIESHNYIIQNTLIGSINNEGESLILLKGGKGGTGNGGMATSVNRAPRETIPPEITETKELLLVLTLKTDVGILGAPSAGKSSLINCLSRANSIIGDYDFTTINPVLGQMYNSNISLMDLPGIIEGAHKGKGKGIEFLRHAEQCKMFLYVIDGKNNPIYHYEMIRNEVEKYGKKLHTIPYVIVINKTDLLQKEELENLQINLSKKINEDYEFNSKKPQEIIFISVKEKEGINNLITIIKNNFYEELLEEEESKTFEEEEKNINLPLINREILIDFYNSENEENNENENQWYDYVNFLKIIGEEILDYLQEKRGFSLILTDSINMKELNLKYRNIHKDTNVISLELEENEFFLGEIILCFNKIQEEYEHISNGEYKNFYEYLTYIYIHGILHLLAYDHINDDDMTIMLHKETEILNYLISNNYISF
jgi:GTP-binding protein